MPKATLFNRPSWMPKEDQEAVCVTHPEDPSIRYRRCIVSSRNGEMDVPPVLRRAFTYCGKCAPRDEHFIMAYEDTAGGLLAKLGATYDVPVESPLCNHTRSLRRDENQVFGGWYCNDCHEGLDVTFHHRGA